MGFYFLKRIFFFACLLSVLPVNSEIREISQNTPKKIVLITIPKSGTHLLAKALELMTGRKVDWIAPSVVANPTFDSNKRLNPFDRTIMKHHLFDCFDFIKADKSGKYIKIVQIRDPRDILLSQINWMANCAWCWYAPRDYNTQFNKWSFDQKLRTTILFPEEDGFYSIRYFLRKALEWINEPDVLVVRFEDLIGPQGGGDKERQEQAIKALANHIGYTLEQEDIDSIASKLFGGTQTFKKGQIGTWREKYSSEHIALFKETMGEELIELGYECDNNW